ncbi:NlpC/P60 family protein [Lachnospiraceae bacterium CLA-AA-H246]|uniref:NlpC/P60 family protein n=1 Tax=Hominisplanchenecus faecis TaxID=2885351 RepID=A0ABS8ESX0_9FIRM|nr:NlpC/P60 family protein [Hominisplanchenecus faecis]MCC2147929.1 NlpC/P60 family protein [Hominisplanchenecus faecis]MCM0706824.1 NlpC/P60 family protein [Faecalicatena sp. BF-R-105]
MKKQIIVTMLLAAALGTVSPSMKAEAKWKADAKGRWYTIKAAPGYAVGWKQIGKYTYYFEKNKYAATGWKLIDKKWYYFDIKGRLLANRWVDGYYLSADGSMAASTVITSGDQSYTIDANGNIVRDPSSADGSDILIPGVTENKNTWVENDGKYYYYNYKGKLAKGWLRIRDKTYYLNTETGERYSGWLKYNGKYYYFDAETGLMLKGWNKIGNYTYFFKTDGSAPRKWKKIKGKYYYFGKKGRMYTNRIISKKYYVNAAGERTYGFAQIGADTYYFHPTTGKMMTGWVLVGSKYYYFDANGKMVTDTWIGKRYLKSNGQMAKSCWVGAYYINKKGNRTKKTRSTGIWTQKGKTYFLNSNYQKAKSQWVVSASGRYYYTDENGIVLTNQWVGNYYVGETGARVTNQKLQIDDKTYYFTSDGSKATGIVTLNGKTYLFDRNGVMVTGWYNNSVATFYFLPTTGEMVKSQIMIIDNVFYSFDANGYMTDQNASDSDLTFGSKIAAYATQFIGNPYVYGGTSLTNGADCSGFTQSVMSHFGIKIPRTADQQAIGYDGTTTKYATAKIISVNNIQPGDLVFYYQPISHVGLYIGNGLIVHASTEAAYPVGGIKTSPFDFATIRAIVRYW